MIPPSRPIIADRYMLLDQLQRGGMTTVHRARDLVTDTVVALKHFDGDRHLPSIQREAYHREVEALRNLEHRHIVRMLDAGQDAEGKPFLVLELMKHDLLAERSAGGPAFAGWDDFSELVVLPLLHALACAHELGIAHRDIKPANILVSAEGIVKLADFGISKLKRWLMPRLTLNDFMSPPFCPPEPDDGNHTYARDVYSVGVLCLWALSDCPLTEHKHVQEALRTFDGPVEIGSILAQAVSTVPSARHESAALLEAQISAVQARRRMVWIERERKRCAFAFTNKAWEAIKDDLGLDDDEAIRRFVSQDINTESAIQRFVENRGSVNERPRPGHYIVLGGTLRYHIAKNDKGRETFAILNFWRPDLHFLQSDRQGSAPSPLTFELIARVGTIGHAEAVDLLERSLEEHDRARKEEERTTKETALFDAWLRVLEAKVQFERELSRPVQFTATSADGSLLMLTTDTPLDGVEIGEARVIELDDGRRIRGEIWEIGANKLVLNCPGVDLKDVPLSGIAKLDLSALLVAVDRQRDAINRVRNATTVKGRLKDLLLDPSCAAPPVPADAIDPALASILDVPQQDAVRAALGSEDLFVIQGPPGTGKTQFITALISETLRRNPAARILLTSQTHVAIDNALERLGQRKVCTRILRIAREQSRRVADAAEPYLVGNQMRAWRADVLNTARRGLAAWAKRHGIDPADMVIGGLARQIAELRKRIEDHRLRIEAEDSRKAGLERMKDAITRPAFQAELEQIKDDIQNLRDDLDADKKQMEVLEKELTDTRGDAKELIGMSPQEQSEWADVLVGDGPIHQLAERLMKLQSEWLNRFGMSDAFLGPLVETSTVVASTCVGLAAVSAVDEVTFDLCIIDEASKATAMESCVPMARARKWVLVGDSEQLPPFREEVLSRPELRDRFGIESEEAAESMFARLSRLLPEKNQAMLTIQYRMVEPIGRLISECFYKKALVSHRKEVDRLLCSGFGFAVNWMSTRELNHREEQKAGTSYVNSAEAATISDLLLDLDERLTDANYQGSKSVIVLSGYGAQVSHLERRLRHIQHKLRHLTVECCTVDRVQGREADVVMFSVTRCNVGSNVGHLRELKRINVALSRARDLLMIVGDDTFVRRAENAEPLRRVLDHIGKWQSECRVWILEDRQSVEGR